ncbi:MAG: indolepyruvate ferredoxin oxidoreductase subunit beta [Methanomicrobia archaeon]|nr:indolepyruvate ferredoxin oxidoreductase subunit beta [Methanomicrobia archaeon]
METNIIISGVGGQGNLLASQILAKAAMNRGYRVRIGETHGMAQRGGAVTSHVRIGDVYGALVPEGRCDYLLGFEPVEALRQIRYMKKDGVAVVNEKPVVPVTVSIGDAVYPDPEKVMRMIESQCKVYRFDAYKIAQKLGNPIVMNIVMIGALCRIGEKLPFTKKDVEDALRERVPEKFLDLDLMALKEGYEVL